MKLFGTDGIRGVANCHPMTSDVALRVGQAFAVFLQQRGHGRKKVVLGKDTRRSCYMIEYALTSGLLSMGVDVFLVGPMPTPACSYLIKSFNADAGLMISASHNPASDNGIKFFDKDGYKLLDAVERELEEVVINGSIDCSRFQGSNIGRTWRIEDARGRYIEHAKSTIDNMSLDGLRVVLDCANGAGYKVAPLIFSELGADVRVYGNEPNGVNINDNCGSEHPTHLQARVEENKADIGIALDGDGDRILLVDEDGRIIDGDKIMCMCATDLWLRDKLPGRTIVATEYSNTGLDLALAKNKIEVRRVSAGDKQVIEAMRAGGFTLGGEQSGHIVFLNHTHTGDGLVTGLQVLQMMKRQDKRLSELGECLVMLPQVTVNVIVREQKPFIELPETSKKIEEVRTILGSCGRVFVRYSGTQSLCRIMVEGESAEQLANDIANTMKGEI